MRDKSIKKLKGCIILRLFVENLFKATERHLPCEITYYYLPPDSGKLAPSLDSPLPRKDERLSWPWC